MYSPVTGRDHLGLLGVSSGEILPSLSPGIIVQSTHPRYHSFYAFVLEEFWERKLARTRQAFIDFYRPCEFVFAVGCQLCNNATHAGTMGVIGSEKTAALARERPAELDPTFDYMKTRLGGYGLYYRGVMAEMGLITPGGQGIAVPLRSGEGAAKFDIDVPTERGSALAARFREAVCDTEYVKAHLASRDPIVLDVVEEFGKAACLCTLQDPEAPDRDMLLDLFLHEGLDPESRRATFRLFLDIADQTDRFALTQPDFRRIVYFGQCGEARYAPREEVGDAFARWRLYQAREYYGYALNTLWAYFCDWGTRSGGDVHTLPLADFLEHCKRHLRLRATAEALEVTSPDLTVSSAWRDLEEWLLGLVGATDALSFDELAGLDGKVQEDALHEQAGRSGGAPAANLTGMMVMLALVALRFGDPHLRTRPEWEVARMGARGRLSFDSFLRDLDELRSRADLTIGEVLQRIIERYVVAQHLMVARGKLPENTFRFERQDGGLRFHQMSNTVTFADSRFNAVSTHLHELGLCSHYGSEAHTLTAEGRRLLDEGDLS